MKNSNVMDYGLFEAGQKNIENFQQYLKQNQEAFTEFCQNNQEIMNEIVELGFKYSGLWQEYLNEQLRRLSNVQDLNDAIATEAGLTTEYSAKFNEANTRFCELLSSSMNKQIEDMHLPMKMEDLLPAATTTAKPSRKKRSKTRSSSGNVH